MHRADVDWRARRAHEVLRRLDLFDKRALPASALTLPDRKRLEVARALATDPKLLLLDEVMAGLRPTETDRMVAILPKLNRETGLTILLIEHVMRAVMALAAASWCCTTARPSRKARREAVVREPAVMQSYLGAEAVDLMLAVENLDVFHGDAQALDDVSLEVGEGSIVAIVGANGAGKTSLIRTIAGMHRPARGRIVFRGTDIAGWPSHRVCNLGIGQVAEGRQVFPVAFGRREPRHGRDAAARARRPRAAISSACSRCFRSWRSAPARLPARCRAASSRCWRSAAA